MKKKLYGLILFLLVIFIPHVFGTHQVGGYISFKCLGGTNYQVTVVDYSNTYGTTVDRDQMTIHYGDGTSALVNRANGPVDGFGYPGGVPSCNYDGSTPLYGARKMNIYQGIHSYPGAGSYGAWVDDSDRMAYINNMTSSVSTAYYMYDTLIINPETGGCVNSPVITNPPVCINGCTGECFYYNPGAYSPDGDSLSYSLGQCLTSGGLVCTNYSTEGATIDRVTGTLKWCSPDSSGIYNFVIRIASLRKVYVNGVKQIITTNIEELELETNIFGCKYTPPLVTSLDTCVPAGDELNLTFTSSLSPYNTLKVNASGLPFSLTPAATFTSTGSDPVHSAFNWQTNCPEVRKQAYLITVKADYPIVVKDTQDPTYDTAFVSGIGTSTVTVVGPAPPYLDATVKGTTVCLNWGASPCPQATGYNIYRHQGCSSWKHGYCETGVPSYTGYTLIGTVKGISNTSFCDSNGGEGLYPGVSYSYVADAIYPVYDSLYLLSDGAQSYASDDTCVYINLSVPAIINVSVTRTSQNNGEIFVRWIKPIADAKDLDTNKFPPPYTYILMRATGMNNNSFSTIATFTSAVFKDTHLDTAFLDAGLLNTAQESYTYKVDFYSGSTFVGSSGSSSSVFLGLRRGDHQMTLNWGSKVPWIDSIFNIYRLDPPPAANYNFIGTSSTTTYTDSNGSVGLSNGYQYCYYVESVSHYGDVNIPHPLFDSSETVCGIPADTIPPCSPPLKVIAKCTLFEDSLVWSNPERLCPKANKVWSYEIYYSPVQNGDPSVIATINAVTNADDTIFVNNNLVSVAGCYAVVAVDSAGQQSAFNTICVDNCPLYTLPNVFTPNGDGANDLFTPLIPYRYVQSIELSIFNRWGNIVFHTINPMVNWNGDDEKTNKPCPDGVYYYVGTVNEIRLKGITPVPLHGYVQISRGK